jgi:PIN domain nuclease of toxin-antitoxin system
LGRDEVIVADTHTFLWWGGARRLLSQAARDALGSADRIVISAITGWEIGMLVSKRRLSLEADPFTWIRDTLERTRIEVVPLQLETAVRAAEYQQLRDPADQQIVATALDLGVPLVTKDDRIRRSGLVETIW